MSGAAKRSRTVLVTGATSGIGRAICEYLLASGHRVVGVGRDFSKVNFASDAFVAVELDLEALDSLPPKLDALAKEWPDVEVVILNAGRGEFGHLETFSYAQIRSLIDLNLISQIFVARLFLPRLKRRGEGLILFMGSESALRGRRQGSLYCASKFALRGLAQALRDECAKSGVRVSIVHPGMVETPFFDALDFAPGESEENALSAEDVAASVAFVVDQPASMVVDEIVLSPLKNVVRGKPSGHRS